MKNRKNGETKKNIAMIRDGLCLTRFSDQGQAGQTFMALKKGGADVSFARGVIVQRFIGKKAKEIADKVEADIEVSKQQLKRGSMTIKTTRTEK